MKYPNRNIRKARRRRNETMVDWYWQYHVARFLRHDAYRWN